MPCCRAAKSAGRPGLDTHLNHPAPAGRQLALRDRILERLAYDVGVPAARATRRDWFIAVALAARDRVVDRVRATASETPVKEVCYLSLEFLIGRLLSDTLGNLGIRDDMQAALADIGVDLEDVCAAEPDAALGNGGLGRLAACFMESMASVGIPAYGYGIRYEHGLFRQLIVDGAQLEAPEDWLASANPWEFERRDLSFDICFGGTADPAHGRAAWQPAETIRAVAYDTSIVGWKACKVNTLRLWSARAVDPLRLADFNSGDHVGAHADRMRAEAISRVLYPGDENAAGRELRLRQEFFFVSASLQDLLRRVKRRHGDVRQLPAHAAVQMNDTHPALAVAELMRLLHDVHHAPWDDAWDIVRRTLSYTNHTLLPEALETWSLALVTRLLPRHMQIIYEINARHLAAAALHGGDDRLLSSVSMIDEHGSRRVRMANLAFVGSHRINGVSALHTDLMKRTIFADLDRVCPGRIVNKTNGITFRRWLHHANPPLCGLLEETLGAGMLDDPELLQGLAPYAEDAAFRQRFAAQRATAKIALARLIAQRTGVAVDTQALFDVHIKRVHEYKRQSLNILHAVAAYQAILANPAGDFVPRVKIFSGKAAAGYRKAKLLIRLAHDVGARVNADPVVADRLKIVWLPNYNVSLAEAIIPGADLSEQISTAGMEASGTGNMKLALNGALTIGTMDGANVEISERVGVDNMFIFGLTADEVAARKSRGLDASVDVDDSPALGNVLHAICTGAFSPDEPDRYRELAEGWIHGDPFMVLADFDAYVAAQHKVDALWKHQDAWWRAAIWNTAHVGWFSSDRTVREYAADIWNINP